MGQHKTNKIIQCVGYAELIIYSRDKKKKYISLIDLEDVTYVEQYSWCIRSKGYVGRVEHGKIIQLHRVLTKCPKNKVVDHINNNKLDNRKVNLRICTFQENLFNSSKRTNNVSGVTGVGFDKKSDKWRARICIDYKNINLGFYEEKEDAIKTRLLAEKENYGEYAPQFHLFAKYNIT